MTPLEKVRRSWHTPSSAASPSLVHRSLLVLAHVSGCSATDNACLSTSQVFINSVATCIEQTCPGAANSPVFPTGVSPNDGYGVVYSAVISHLSATPISRTGVSSPAATSIASSSSIPASSSGGSGTLTTSAISSIISSNSANGRSTVMIGPIVGGVVGFLVLVVFVEGLMWFCKSRRKRIRSEFSPTSAEHSLVLPSSTVEPFRIPSAVAQNYGRLPASPTMKQVEATRSLIPTTTQTPSSMQMPSSSAGTPLSSGLYSHAMVGSGSRMVLHQDSGIRLPRPAGEDEVVVEMPPLYTPG